MHTPSAPAERPLFSIQDHGSKANNAVHFAKQARCLLKSDQLAILHELCDSSPGDSELRADLETLCARETRQVEDRAALLRLAGIYTSNAHEIAASARPYSTWSPRGDRVNSLPLIR